jgi:RNA polymerase sigma-70 factor (family 1)
LKERLHNERLLIEEMQTGNTDAFAVLYRHYHPQLYVNILGMVREPKIAEDLVQELFTRIWQKKDAPVLKENFEGYLYRTAYHLVVDYFRKLKRDQKLLQRFRWFASENITSIEEALFHRHSATILQRAIDQLPKQQKRVYELVRINKLSYKEAAALMGISVNTVKEHLAATIKSIQNFLLNHTSGYDLLLLLATLLIGA